MLTIQNLTKTYGQLRAVDGVSLTVPAGQIIGLIGPNGSGKSTLLSLAAGSQRADGGRILFDGYDITQRPSHEISRRGLVRSYQEPALFFRMTALDNLLLPAKEQRGETPLWAPFHRSWRTQEEEQAERSSAILDQLRLGSHYESLAADLSGGQMKLLELGRSLMGTPRLLLLDEPTAGVAPALAFTIFEQIATLRATLGLTFLIVEHRLEILFDFVDSLYVMHLGRLIAQGSPNEIAQNAHVREVYLGD